MGDSVDEEYGVGLNILNFAAVINLRGFVVMQESAYGYSTIISWDFAVGLLPAGRYKKLVRQPLQIPVKSPSGKYTKVTHMMALANLIADSPLFKPHETCYSRWWGRGRYCISRWRRLADENFAPLVWKTPIEIRTAKVEESNLKLWFGLHMSDETQPPKKKQQQRKKLNNDDSSPVSAES